MLEMRCDYYGHLYASSKFPLKINSLSSVSTDFSIYFSGGSVPFNSCVNIPNPLSGNLLCFLYLFQVSLSGGFKRCFLDGCNYDVTFNTAVCRKVSPLSKI